MRGHAGVADSSRPDVLCNLPQTDAPTGGHSAAQVADSSARLVSGAVAGLHPESRPECGRDAAVLGTGQLSDSLAAPAEAASGDSPARPRTASGHSGNGRDAPGRDRIWCPRTAAGRQVPGGGCRGTGRGCGGTEAEFPHVHLVSSLLKRWLLGTHRGSVGSKHLQGYLDEFRFNRRKSRHVGKIIYRLAEQLISHQPITYKVLITRSNPSSSS